MDDAISRQSVIDMLDETKRIVRQNIDGAVLMTFERVFDSLVNITNALPTIQPAEPKRGKWIDDGSELGCQCSQCGKTLDEYINCGTEYMTLTEIPKFCPNCGADMREVTT